MSAAAVEGMAPVAMEENPTVMPEAVVNVVDADNDDEEDDLHFKRARGKRSAVREKSGEGEDQADEDTSPRGPIDASQRDSPPKSSDDEGEAEANDDDVKLPGKKKFKLRRKGAAEEEVAAKLAKRADFGELPSDSEDDEEGTADGAAKANKATTFEEEDGEDFYYDEDDEEGIMEQRLREKGTLSEDEEDVNAAADDEESDESDLEDSEDEDELDDEFGARAKAAAARAAQTAADAAKVAEEPEFRNLETEEEIEARRAKEKEETQRTQTEIMREASKRARLTGYHVAPDRDPFAYRKVFAHIRACVEKLNLPPPPPDAALEDEMNFDGEVADEEENDDEEEEAEDDSEAEDLELEEEEDEEEEMVELELEGGVAMAAAADNADDDMAAALGLDGDELAAMMAVVKAKAPAKKSVEPRVEVTPVVVDDEDEDNDENVGGVTTLDTSAEAAAKELAAQKALEERDAAAEAAAANAANSEDDDDDDLSEEEDHEMTRKERLRQIKRAKAFFKADAKSAATRRAGQVLEDEAEMSDDGGHTDDEEEVEIEVEEVDGAAERVIKRKVAKRKDGLLDREELEEMVDYIDFNDTGDDDERRMAKRARAHARFEEERDDEDMRKMQELFKNGFRRQNKNHGGGGLMGEDGPDYWQRRRRVNVNGDEESDEEDDFGIEVPDRAWEHVEVSDDDDGGWAERAERRKRAAVAEAAAKKTAAAQNNGNGGTTEENDDVAAGEEDSQLPSARDMGFGSQDFKAMMNAGRQRRNRVQRGPGAAASAMESGHVGGGGSFGAFAPPAPQSVGVVGGSRLGPAAQRPVALERQASTSFLGRGAASRSNHAGGGGGGGGGGLTTGLSRAVSLGAGGASRSFVFGGGGDSQSMWDRDAEENGTAPPAPTVLTELGGNDNARTDFGWAPREAAGAKGVAAAAVAAPPKAGNQSLFSMLQTSQGWDEVLGQSDSLAEGVKAAKNIKLRPAVPR